MGQALPANDLILGFGNWRIMYLRAPTGALYIKSTFAVVESAGENQIFLIMRP